MAERAEPPSEFNQGLYEYRLSSMELSIKELTKTTATLVEKINSLSYVPRHEFDEYKDSVDEKLTKLREYADRKYRTKEEGKTWRNVGVAVITALCIALGTIALNFVLKGGLVGPGR